MINTYLQIYQIYSNVKGGAIQTRLLRQLRTFCQKYLGSRLAR